MTDTYGANGGRQDGHQWKTEFGSDESLNYGREFMMTERKPRNSSKKRASLGFVLMLLLSSLGALATVPAASAALPGSIGITDSTSPLPDAWYSSFDTIEFEAEVTNYYAAASGAARTLKVCL